MTVIIPQSSRRIMSLMMESCRCGMSTLAYWVQSAWMLEEISGLNVMGSENLVVPHSGYASKLRQKDNILLKNDYGLFLRCRHNPKRSSSVREIDVLLTSVRMSANARISGIFGWIKSKLEGLKMKINRSLHSEPIIKLQYSLQHKDLLSNSPAKLRVKGCVCVAIFACRWVLCETFTPPSCSDRTRPSSFASHSSRSGPHSHRVTRLNTSAIQSLRRFIQPVPGLLSLVKKIIFVFPTALWTTKSSCFILVRAVKPCPSPCQPTSTVSCCSCSVTVQVCVCVCVCVCVWVCVCVCWVHKGKHRNSRWRSQLLEIFGVYLLLFFSYSLFLFIYFIFRTGTVWSFNLIASEVDIVPEFLFFLLYFPKSLR